VLLCALFGAITLVAGQNGDEHIPPDEPERIQRITNIFADEMVEAFNDGEKWLRNAHGKQHGCFQALFVVPQLPANLAQGIFAAPASYPAFVRFSNGAGRGFSTTLKADESDLIPDTRGLAIKILGVSGTNLSFVGDTQDFLLTTSRNGFLSDGPTAEGFFTAISQGTIKAAAFLATHPSVAKGLIQLGVDGTITNPLTATYWQQVPSRFGARAAKFRLSPCSSNQNANTGYAEDGILGSLMKNKLEKAFNTTNYQGGICFDFAVQFFLSDFLTPIEDPTVQWDSNWSTVAQLRFLTNQPYAWRGAQDAFCRHLGYNPWNSIVEHRPLGFVQRIRRGVYTNDNFRRWNLRHESFAPPTVQDWNDYGKLQ